MSCHDGECRRARAKVQGQCDRSNENLFQQNGWSQHLPTALQPALDSQLTSGRQQGNTHCHISVCMHTLHVCIFMDFFLHLEDFDRPWDYSHFVSHRKGECEGQMERLLLLGKCIKRISQNKKNEEERKLGIHVPLVRQHPETLTPAQGALGAQAPWEKDLTSAAFCWHIIVCLCFTATNNNIKFGLKTCWQTFAHKGSDQ